jgi:hypothetical protein
MLLILVKKLLILKYGPLLSWTLCIMLNDGLPGEKKIGKNTKKVVVA